MLASTVERIRADLPELPADRRQRLGQLGLDSHVVNVLSSSDPDLRRVFDEAVALGADPVMSANWITGEVTAAVRKSEAVTTALTGADLAELVKMVGAGSLSSSAAKDVLAGVLAGEGSPRAVADARDLMQVSDEGLIAAAVEQVLAANPEAIERFRGGEEKVLGFLVGQVMRATSGKADPKLVNALVRQRIT
jgi:aspartyl-tRNA(Asn)/glutamyl-tRNA(Gln) amidotransferase subunit B